MLLQELILIKENPELVAHDVDWDGNLRISVGNGEYDANKPYGDVQICLNGYPKPGDFTINYSTPKLKDKASEIIKLAKNAYIHAYVAGFPHNKTYTYSALPSMDIIVKQVLSRYKDRSWSDEIKILQQTGLKLPENVLAALNKSMGRK